MLLRRINGKKVSPTPRHKHPQSHNGAIAAGSIGVMTAGVIAVSIPQWCDCCPGEAKQRVPVDTFQSHNGAIAAEISTDGSILGYMFQSHNGAIAAWAFVVVIALGAYVSIPQWCDCCCRSNSLACGCFSVSIPQWCDCCAAAVVKPLKPLQVSIPQWCDCCSRASRSR